MLTVYRGTVENIIIELKTRDESALNKLFLTAPLQSYFARLIASGN